MATRVLLILRLSLCCAAFSWPRQISHLNVAGNTIHAEPVEDELTGLLANHAALESYSRRPDCFRRVAATIRLRCGELEMDEDERVKAAISMTLCELATATHHSIPLECASFTVDSESPPMQIQGECVDALSRSAQFWSSYSGYLREVPQLCFAFRRWNDIDTAKDIYKNSTLESMTLIRLILAREQADVAGKKRWDTQISELEDVSKRLIAMSSQMDVALNAATPRLETELTMIIEAFKSGLTDIQLNHRVENSRMIDQINSELQLISQRHAHFLNEIVHFFQESLANDLNNALSPFRTQSMQALDVANSAQERWVDLTIQISTMQQKILELSESVGDTIMTLEASVKQAQAVHDAQIDASLSASHLGETLARLTATTQDSLDKFNASATLLTQSLFPRGGLAEIMRLMEVFLHIDPSTLSYLRHLPVFPAVSILLSVLIYLIRSSFSVLMSIALLFLSLRKYIVKPIMDQEASANKSCHDMLNSQPLPTRIRRDAEIIPPPRIRKYSLIPDRLCKHPSR
ncbi:hypothetical protein C8R43DRAFT_606360 [Mycena crocata]|nr:hypothetical protein C8R43DRAFT_606360 [Mycena crocata]